MIFPRGAAPSLRGCAIFAIAILFGLSADRAFAQGPYTWNGNTTANWSVSSSWTGSQPIAGGGTSATDIVNFNGTTGAAYTSTNDLTGTYALNQLVINNTGGTGLFTLAGNALSFGGTNPVLTVASTDTAAATISTTITLAAATAIANYSAAALTISGNITNAANTITFVGSGPTTITGIIGSGAGGLTVGGAGIAGGTVTLANFNTYTAGNTTVTNNGTLLLDFFAGRGVRPPAINIINSVSNTSALILGGTGGGTLTINGGGAGATNSQQFNGLTINAGASSFVFTMNGATSLTASVGAITRSTGGTIDFTLPSGSSVTTSTINGSNQILGGYATVGGMTWAVTGASGINPITGLASGSYTTTTSTPSRRRRPRTSM